MINFFQDKQNSGAVSPVFYCENCGSEVPEDDNVCPNCKKRFAGVKCPRCYYEGTAGDFENGCPQCRYDPHKKQKNKSEYPLRPAPAAVPETQTFYQRPRLRIFSSFTLVGILLIAITLVALLYML